MLDRRSMFDWLAEPSSPLRNREEFSEQMTSIFSHLRNLLNTRQGSVEIGSEYGVPDFSNPVGSLDTGDPVDIENAILAAVKRFEPRIKAPSVRLLGNVDDGQDLRFEIRGTVVSGGGGSAVPLSCEALVAASGKVKMNAGGVL